MLDPQSQSRGEVQGDATCLPTFNARPMPLPGESWVGYLIRFSEMNGLTGVRRVLGHLHETAVSTLPQDPQAVLAGLGVDAGGWVQQSQLQSVSKSRKLSNRSKAELGYSRYFRVCTDCLRNDSTPFVRSAWTHPVALTCKTHRTLLTDTCPACNKLFDWSMRSVRRCRCGHDLLQQSSSPAPAWANHLDALFKESPPDEMSDTFAMSTRKARLAAGLVSWLLKPLKETTGLRQRSSRDTGKLLNMKLAANAKDWTLGWPVSLLDELIRRYRLETTEDLKRMKACLGVRHFSAMRDLADQVMRRQAALDTQRLSMPPPDANAETVPVLRSDHLGLVTGMSRLRLVAAVKAGEFSGVALITYGARKKQDVRLSYDTFAAIQASYEESMSCQQVCRSLGLSWRDVQQLRIDGHIHEVEKTRTGGTQRFWKRDVEEVARRLTRSVTTDSAQNLSKMPSGLDLTIQTVDSASPQVQKRRLTPAKAQQRPSSAPVAYQGHSN